MERHGGGCPRLGARTPRASRGFRCTSNSAHVTRCALSTLGGGGNRTPVLRRIIKASPGAACCSFLSPGSGAGSLPRAQSLFDFPACPVTEPTGGASYRCQVLERRRL